jgi:hypothetical protein
MISATASYEDLATEKGEFANAVDTSTGLPTLFNGDGTLKIQGTSHPIEVILDDIKVSTEFNYACGGGGVGSIKSEFSGIARGQLYSGAIQGTSHQNLGSATVPEFTEMTWNGISYYSEDPMAFGTTNWSGAWANTTTGRIYTGLSTGSYGGGASGTVEPNGVIKEILDNIVVGNINGGTIPGLLTTSLDFSTTGAWAFTHEQINGLDCENQGEAGYPDIHCSLGIFDRAIFDCDAELEPED